MTVHIDHGVYQPSVAHVHFGAVGVNGGPIFPFTSATTPIDQTFNVTTQNVTDLLAGNYYANVHSAANGSGEIRGQLVDDPSSCSVTVDTGPVDSDGDGVVDSLDAFPHNPYGQTDTDHDGIGDEWEMHWFGNLTTADATSDTDNDGVSDVVEFQNAILGFDPLDGSSQLPVMGGAGLAGLSALLVLAARRRK